MTKPECYLCTVWHTGTKYFKAGLEKKYRVAYSHFNESVLRQIPNYEEVYTTYRDPYRVAASWGNRGHFSHRDNSGVYAKWDAQWECYKEALRLNPIILDFTQGQIQHDIDFGEEVINSHADAKHFHRELDNGNIDYLFRSIPQKHIDHAIECAKAATERTANHEKTDVS